ncbi:receptor-like serine/threonine-protein kinase NCRK [Iris pallida]|uniref:Receptor-like serine/threonine-protein kinase NCRK n=1 Tax=Iris pallida TaxID=29817 RepID=A0AAX6G880_IRIPA|nr:receptor-like serine/threonine-protein kinase NCRK [Iris pallida]
MTCSASSMLLLLKPILMRMRRMSRGRQQIHNSANRRNESLVIWAMTRLHDSKLVVIELPDQLLIGNIPEEEMQMMAHLARECLQWDPDSWLTMSPRMSIRKSMPAAFFMKCIRLHCSAYSYRSLSFKTLENANLVLCNHYTCFCFDVLHNKQA